MATTNKLYYYAVRGMTRKEMIHYIALFTEDLELRVILNSFDNLTKAAILDFQMIATLEEAENILKLKQEHERYLKKLEGRIMMLIFQQHMAKQLNKKERMFENSQRISKLFAEYQMEGGTRSFQSPAY